MHGITTVETEEADLDDIETYQEIIDSRDPPVRGYPESDVQRMGLAETEFWLCTSIHMPIITRDNGSEKNYVQFSARHCNAWLTSSAVTLTSLPTGNLAEKPAVQFLVALFLRYLKTP